MSFIDVLLLHPIKASASIDNCQRIRNERENPYLDDCLPSETEENDNIDEIIDSNKRKKKVEEEYSYEETISEASEEKNNENEEEVVKEDNKNEENINPSTDIKLEDTVKENEVEELLPNPKIEDNEVTKSINKNVKKYELKQKNSLAANNITFKQNMYHTIEIVAINSHNVVFKRSYPVKLDMKINDFITRWAINNNLEFLNLVIFLNGVVLNDDLKKKDFSFFIKNICKNKDIYDVNEEEKNVEKVDNADENVNKKEDKKETKKEKKKQVNNKKEFKEEKEKVSKVSEKPVVNKSNKEAVFVEARNINLGIVIKKPNLINLEFSEKTSAIISKYSKGTENIDTKKFTYLFSVSKNIEVESLIICNGDYKKITIVDTCLNTERFKSKAIDDNDEKNEKEKKKNKNKDEGDKTVFDIDWPVINNNNAKFLKSSNDIMFKKIDLSKKISKNNKDESKDETITLQLSLEKEYVKKHNQASLDNHNKIHGNVDEYSEKTKKSLLNYDNKFVFQKNRVYLMEFDMTTDCYVSGLINKTTKNFYTNTFTTGEEIDMEIFAHLYTGKHKEIIFLGLNFKLYSNLNSNLN